MRILITGGRGQLGRALEQSLSGHELLVSDLPELDITERRGLEAAFADFRPGLVIHAAALTDVDGCARDPKEAYRINAFGTQNVALACLASGAILVHISTNEVFSGDDPSGYEEWRPLAPINAYGRSKAAAEVHIRALLERYYIVRTAWLYAPGGRNFVHAILNRARTTGALRVVADEIGNPTYVKDLASAVAGLIEAGQFGTYHFVNEGSCSRWAFAQEIVRLGGLEGIANRPIRLRDYPRPSTPPPFGALHNHNGAALGIVLRPWPEALAEFMGEAHTAPSEAGGQ